MSQNTTQEFGKWRGRLWPVHTYELKKLLPMFFMFFFISFNYTILRDTKDTLVVTAAGSGAEAIPFLKVYGTVPAAMIFMMIYSKLANTLSKEKLFYSCIIPFLVFFGAFATVIYPNIDIIHPTTSADWLQSVLPAGFKGLIACYRNWSYSLFYIMAELWGSVALSLLFWGFANEITKVTEAKRFYTLFGLGANLALVVSGPAIVAVSKIRASVPAGVDAWQISLNYLMGMVVLAGIGAVAIYYWINRNILTDPRFYDPEQVSTKKKKKSNMSIGESLMFLARSKYIGCLAILVIAYGISINLVEVTWKNQLKLQYSNPNDYSAFMGNFSFYTGAVTIFMMLFVGGNCLRRGWGFAAMITPLMLTVTGLLFFAFILFKENATVVAFTATLGATPLLLGVIIGAAQNILSKSAKYSLFDPTKEIAYIPLDAESKTKGKAAIDVVAARLGKSGGSLIQQGLLVLCGGIGAITPYVAVILLVIVSAWLVAVRSLNTQFLALSEQREQEAKEAQAEAAAQATA
ncbi:MAG: AAA family ATPase [Waddliaceae bacterium]|nr:AAA family ATPase [Waddliaceae bacterium]